MISLATETERTPVLRFSPSRFGLGARIRDRLRLNQRDLPNIPPVDLLSTELRKKNEPVVEAVAFQGVGVFETLKEIARQVLTELKAGG